ncbi:putative polyketide synthase [Cadophora sp. DSE1049]|nr:putative polyketide synthase [Cadophora sp. DSE1049]
MAKDKSMPIAVIGMSFRGPKDATSVENLWKMISEQREGWSKIPKERWNNDAFYHVDNARHGTINVEGGHFFEENLAHFDAPFFNMTNSEAAALDPQQRLLLEGAFEAFENGGIPLERIMGTKTSCFVGSFSGDYTDMLLRDPDCVPMYQCTNAGQSRAMTANRVSYFFDLKGPSVTVDTACSGSLIALHLACQSLRTGEVKLAFAAGVNTILSHEFMTTMSMMKFLSPDGRCYTFDERANGYARGEGVGCLILKPLEDALKDNDTIRAIIRGSGSNSDGKTSGITLPNGAAQAELIRDVYDTAGLDPLETEYVECHGTGTQAGDPQETGALAQVFSAGRSPETPLRIGSIKTNVGHLEGASGIAGVIKGIMMLESRTFLPNRNFRNINPRIPLEEWKLKIQLETESWNSVGPHRISVNSFGYGGSNAHVILEDSEGYLRSRGLKGSFKRIKPLLPIHEEKNAIAVAGTNDHLNGVVSHLKKGRPRLFSLSSFDEASGKRQIESLLTYLKGREHSRASEDEFMSDLAYTLNERRTNFMWKFAVPATSPRSLIEVLENGGKHSRSVKKPTISFIFTGQGAQWCGMGKELLETFPVFGESIDRIGTYLNSLGAPFDVKAEMTRDPKESQINLALYSQTMCSAVQIAMVDLLRSWKIKPASVTGHSSGEIAAAYTMGALSMEDAMAAAYYRGLASHNMQKSRRENGEGAMMAVGMSQTEVEPLLKDLKEGVAVVACVNSPTSVTISGDEAAINELLAILHERKLFARKLAVEVAYHSPHMDFVADEYRASLTKLSPKQQLAADGADENGVEFFSSVFGARASASSLGPEYWVQNMLGQVKFADALRLLCLETTEPSARGKGRARKKRVGAATKVTVDILIEIGPHSALAGPIKQILRHDPKLNAASPFYASALVRKTNSVTSTLSLAASLLTSGYPIDVAAINRPRDVGIDYQTEVLVDLPPYPWNHVNSYWAEPRISKVYRTKSFPRTDLLGVLDRNSSTLEPRWRNFIRVTEIPWIKDHRIQSNVVFPAAGYIVIALEAVFQIAWTRSDVTIIGYSLRDVAIGAALIITEQAPVEVITSMRPYGNVDRSSSDLWYEFAVTSVTDDNRWTEHCRGLISVHSATNIINEVSGEADSIAEAASHVRVREFYDHLATIGLQYGETFAGMNKAYSARHTCIAEVTISDTAATMPKNFQYPLVIHPSTLDAILHPIFVALSADKLIENPAVPTSIENIFISNTIGSNPGHRLRVCASTKTKDDGHLVADLAVVDNGDTSQGELVVSIKGLTCTILAGDGEESPDQNFQRIAYNLHWEPDVDLLTTAHATTLVASDMCGADDLRLIALYEMAASHYITAAFRNIQPGDFSITDPHLQKQYYAQDGMTRSLKAKRMEHPEYIVENLDHATIGDIIQEVKASGPEGELLCVVSEYVAEIFQNKVDIWSVITAENRLELYRSKTPRLVRNYDAAGRYLSLLGHKNPHMSILEVSAGAGSATLRILQTIGGHHGEAPSFEKYTITNPDASTFDTTSLAFEPWKDCLEFKALDIEGDLHDQGYDSNRFDIVILAHGTHMAKSRGAVLKNVHTLLNSNGRLILIDTVAESQSIAQKMILGNFPTWSSEPAHSQTEIAWEEALIQAGFSGLELSVRDMAEQTGFERSMMVSKVMSGSKPSKPSVLLVVEEEDCGVSLDKLENLLCGIGLQVEITSFANAKTSGKTCIVLSELTSPIFDRPDATRYESIKDIFIRSSGVLWVVRGGTKNPTASLVTGFSRTARSETGERTIVTLDLDAENVATSDAAARIIFGLFQNHFTLGLALKDLDTEYAEKNGVLMIPRIVESPEVNSKIASLLGKPVPVDQPLYQNNRPLRAVIGAPGKLETVHFSDVEHVGDVPTGFVEIEVRSFGLDKKDVQSAFAQLSSHSFGNECSGTVRAVGKDVHECNVGDRVTCYGSGTIASYYRGRASSFQKIPDDMSFELAAAIPTAYCTAYYAVYNLARVSRADTVLVHNATEPCSQAIIEICKLIGAQVFATVASLPQKQFIAEERILPESQILFKGDASFAKSIMRITKGEGIDVIFNSDAASGEMQRLSWSCIAPYGRFIELSGQDLTNGSRLEMGNFSKDVMFAAFNLTNLIKRKPKATDRLLSDIIGLFSAGILRGPSTIVRYKISDIHKALQDIHDERVLSKVILTTNNSDTYVKEGLSLSAGLLKSDASYLLVGGLGGIGRAIAMWMLDHGAKNIIFANRSGQTKQVAKETVHALEARGARVAVYSCDVGNDLQVTGMVTKAGNALPPIKGVIQAAMVLKDAMIENLSVDDYNAVLQPKVQGTWNLHKVLPRNMDFFIMLSSVSGVIGNASQSAYAAAGTFMDAFAVYRNSLGLPAVTLDLGVITGIGYLSENQELAAAMELQGFEGTNEAKLMALIESAIFEPRREGALSQTITGLGTWKKGQSLGNFDVSLFAKFRRRGLDDIEGGETSSEETLRQDIRASTTMAEATASVCAALVNKLAVRLGTPVDNIVSSKTISEYGVDSLVAVEMRNWIAKDIESQVPILEILANQSLTQLSAKIAAKSKLVKVKLEED